MFLNFDKNNVFYFLRHLAVMISFVVIIEVLKYLFNIVDPINNKLKDEFLLNFVWSSFGVIIISPIFEEIIFRLPLKKNNYFWVSIVFSLVFLLSSNFTIVKIICLLFVVSIIMYQFFDKFILLHYILIVFSVITFVFVHFGNYDRNEFNVMRLVDLIFLFLPQFFIALVLTKIRLQTSLLNSIIFHSIYNFIILLFALSFNF